MRGRIPTLPTILDLGVGTYYTGPRPRLPATRLVVRMCVPHRLWFDRYVAKTGNRDSRSRLGGVSRYRRYSSIVRTQARPELRVSVFGPFLRPRTPWPNGIGNYLSLTRSNHADSHIHVSMFETRHDKGRADTRVVLRPDHVSNSDHDSDMPRVRATLLTFVSIFTNVADAHCPVAHCIGIGYAICVFRQPRPAGLRMKRDKDEIATWRLDPAAPCRK